MRVCMGVSKDVLGSQAKIARSNVWKETKSSYLFILSRSAHNSCRLHHHFS